MYSSLLHWGLQNLGKALDRINAYSEIDFNFYGSRERRFMLVRGGMRPKGEVGWG